MHFVLFGIDPTISSNLLVYPSPVAIYPCAPVLYLYLPHGVINVVRWRSSVWSGTLITIPAVKHGFLCIVGNCASLVERRLCVMSLSCCMDVECLEINSSSGFPILSGCYDHLVAPSNRFANRNWFYDSESNILIKACFNILLPVKWHWNWLMVGNRFCFWINH